MSRSRTRSGLAVLAAIAAAVTVAGCGFGAGPGTKNASIQVTSGFGSHLIGRAVERHVPGAETVMSLLERHFKVNHSLRRRLCRVDRRPQRRLEPPSTGSTTSTGSRRPGRRGDRRPQGRPHLVGPARLGRDGLDPGGRRLLPGAVHQRDRRQGVSDAAQLRARRPGRVQPYRHDAAQGRRQGRRPGARNRVRIRLARRRRRHLE